MKVDERKIILNTLDILKNARFNRIGRCINMIWIIFSGKDGEEYAFDIQSFFRICRQDRILITGFDKYQPTKTIVSNPLFKPETYDYDVQGDNLFDEWVINKGRDILSNSYIQKIELNNFGDLILYMSNDLVLTIFWDRTNINECWRVFKRKSKNKHLVITGHGVEDLEEWVNEFK